MIKSELVQRMAARNPHLYQRDIENIIDAILGEITNALARGERVELRGFGAFSTKQRQARTGRNPRTGDKVPVTEKLAPFFKTGKEMRERLNRSATRSRIFGTIARWRELDRSRDEACMVRFLKVAILALCAIILLGFAFANRDLVTVSFDPFASSDSAAFSIDAPLFAVVIVAAMLGVVAGASATWLSQGRHRKSSRQNRSRGGQMARASSSA